MKTAGSEADSLSTTMGEGTAGVKDVGAAPNHQLGARGYTGGPFLSLPAAPADSLIKVAWLGNPPRTNLVFGMVPRPREVDAVRDVLMLLAVILSIPFVILAFGLPIALVAQLFLWIGRLF